MQHLSAQFDDADKQHFFDEHFKGENNDDDKQRKIKQRQFLDVDFVALAAQLGRLLEAANFKRQVLCHNDLLVNNIIYDESRGMRALLARLLERRPLFRRRKLHRLRVYGRQLSALRYCKSFQRICRCVARARTLVNQIAALVGVEELDFSLLPSDEQKRQFLASYFDSFNGRKTSDEEIVAALDDLPRFEAVSDERRAAKRLICLDILGFTPFLARLGDLSGQKLDHRL